MQSLGHVIRSASCAGHPSIPFSMLNIYTVPTLFRHHHLKPFRFPPDATGLATLGKPQGSDKGLDKATYVSLLGLEAARSKAAELSDEALESLSSFPASADPLRKLAAYIVNRIN